MKFRINGSICFHYLVLSVSIMEIVSKLLRKSQLGLIDEGGGRLGFLLPGCVC